MCDDMNLQLTETEGEDEEEKGKMQRGKAIKRRLLIQNKVQNTR